MLLKQVALASSYGAVMAIDGHTAAPLPGALLTFDGQTLPVRYKKDGYCVLLAPTGQAKTCTVACPGYAPARLPVTADGNGRFFGLAALMPLAGNPRYLRVRCLRFAVVQKGLPVAGAQVGIALTGKLPALMVTQPAAKGDTAIRLNTEGEPRLVGQWLELGDSRAQIAHEVEGTPGLYQLDRPLGAAVKQSAQAVPFWLTESDDKGEVIMPFKPHLMRQGPQSLAITCNGKTVAVESAFAPDSPAMNVEI